MTEPIALPPVPYLLWLVQPQLDQASTVAVSPAGCFQHAGSAIIAGCRERLQVRAGALSARDSVSERESEPPDPAWGLVAPCLSPRLADDELYSHARDVDGHVRRELTALAHLVKRHWHPEGTNI